MNFILYVHDTSDTPVWPFPTSEAQVTREINDLVVPYTTGLVTVDAVAGVFVPLAAVQTALDALDTWLDDIEMGVEDADADRRADIENARDAVYEALREAGVEDEE